MPELTAILFRCSPLWREADMSDTYAAEISRKDPACILFLLDQSYSMNDPFAGNQSVRKANAAADALNKLLMTLALRCTKNIGEGPRNYFDVGVIGYGSHRGVGSCFEGALKGRTLVPIKEVADNYLRVEERVRTVSDGAGGLVDTKAKFPVWFDPIAENGTPMAEALQLAHRTVRKWISGHKRSYPPIVINITDGEPSTDPTAAAKALAGERSDDGHVLLYNVHLSWLAAEPLLYPDRSAGLPDDFARMLFEMSSVFPPPIRQEFEREGYYVTADARGFVFNADASAFITFLDIGTRLALKEDSPGER
jgi:hypothetical protein